MERLDLDAARAATVGGLILGAGGGGLDEGFAAAEALAGIGAPRLASLDELDESDGVVISTSVGAPSARSVTSAGIAGEQRQRRRAFELLTTTLPPETPAIRATMCSHPGAWISETWLHAAEDDRLCVVDAAANGRGHPTVEMGGLGLAGRDDVAVHQAAAGGSPSLEVTAHGTLAQTSNVLRAASIAAGGLIAACRGPFSVGFCREAAAVGAVTTSIRLGHAVLDARPRGPTAVVEAVIETLHGRLIAEGVVSEHESRFVDGFDVGQVVLDTSDGRVEVGICNEYLYAEVAQCRLASFPDLIVLFSAQDGLPVPAARLEQGTRLYAVAVCRDNIPLGAGVRDPSVYPEVERLTGATLAAYALGGPSSPESSERRSDD